MTLILQIFIDSTCAIPIFLPLTCRGNGVALAEHFSTGNSAMKSGQQDSKTEPASHATVWNFSLGNSSLGDSNNNLQSVSKEAIIGA